MLLYPSLVVRTALTLKQESKSVEKETTYSVLAYIRPAALAKLPRDPVILLKRPGLSSYILEAVKRDLDTLSGGSRARDVEWWITFVVRPKLVPNARRQLRQWQRDVRAVSGESRDKL